MKRNRFFLARQASGLKQTTVATQLGLKSSAVSKWERGITLPDGRTLIKVAKLYNTSADYLLGIDPSFSGLPYEDCPDRSEMLEIYERLTPAQKDNLLNYAKGIAAANMIADIEQCKLRR